MPNLGPYDKLKREIQTCITRRERYFQRVQQAFDLISQCTQPDIKNEFLSRCERLDQTFSEFEVVQDRMVELNTELDSDDRVEDTLAKASSFEDLFYKVKAAYEASKPPPAPRGPDNVQLPPAPPTPRAKLPVVNIPPFSGDYQLFPSFKSLFDALIHSNTQISNIEKYSYLTSLVTGSASHTIQSIPFDADHYLSAYNALVTKYTNKRIIANHYCQKLFGIKPMTSDSQLKVFVEQFHVYVEALKNSGVPNLSDFLLMFMGLRILDPATRQAFEQDNVHSIGMPSYQELFKFIQGRISVAELLGVTKPASTPKPAKPFQPQNQPSRSFVGNVTSDKSKNESKDRGSQHVCPCCQQSHRINECTQFLALSISDRYELLKKHSLCHACFGPHFRSNCKSKHSCRHCGKRSHHSLLHSERPMVDPAVTAPKAVPAVPAPHVEPPATSSTLSCVQKNPASHQVLLGTALVTIADIYGRPHQVRMIIDSGSQLSIMTQSLASRLCLPSRPSNLQISGIGSSSPQKAKGVVSCVLKSRANHAMLSVDAVVLSTIAANIPAVPVSLDVVKRLSSFQLADPTFHQPSTVDILIGAQYYADIIDSSQPVVHGEPSLIPSIFGALVMGLAQSATTPVPQQVFFVQDETTALNNQLRKFWEMEEIALPTPQSPDDLYCEEHFLRTHYRESSGQYVVRLPFKDDTVPDFGDNQKYAMNRLMKLENRLRHHDEFRKLYHENLKDYVDSGHMVPAKTLSKYLLTHHGVLKESSSTTKVRVVFNPAERSSPSHLSLNEALHIGPKLQNDINDILLNFRLHTVAFTADIKQMYRCIKLHPEDSRHQQILWRFDDGDVQQFEITCVCFGVSSSPYQACRVIKQLAIDEGRQYPDAAKVLETDIYIDDVVTGASSIEEACMLRHQLSSILASGGFELRKWSCSDPRVLQNMSCDMLEKPHPLGDKETIRVLGLQWDSRDDSFCYDVKPIEDCSSKRQVLSQIARIYDLTGFISPVTVWMKILMQRLWVLGGAWDDPLPSDLQREWNNFVAELPVLQTLRIPRYICDTYIQPPELIGFADASSAAMGVAVYLKIVCSDGRVLTNLIRAKSRVAPLKSSTIPRLELCAAHMLSQVIVSLSSLCQRLKITTIHLFTDSMVVLYWLQTPPHQLKVFTANRVVKVLELTPASSWRHVRSELNPADVASRGCRASQLINNDLWWYGPPFIKDDSGSWPCNELEPMSVVPELRTNLPTCLATISPPFDMSIIERFSALSRAQRVIAWILRFVKNARLPPSQRCRASLTVEELKHAEERMVKITQHHYYHHEIKSIEKNEKLPSSLLQLHPFIFNQCIRVGGRIDKAPLPYDSRHPFLIPPKSHLALLLIRHYHAVSIHGGPKIVQTLIQERYYIFGLRNLVRKVIFQCVKCFRLKAKPQQPFMADLPVTRFEQGRPFVHTGVDLAGSFSLKDSYRRTNRANPPLKAYFAIFVCFSTKAIHLEPLTSLSTECFLACFDRFVARRGLPSKVFSDRGTNFVGAARVLDETVKFLRNNSSSICDHLSRQGILWTFNCPMNPSSGGLWEAGVKSVKAHLKFLLNDRTLTFEEFSTALSRIEAILNSRPLGVPSNLPEDGLECLTPGHFLVGAPLVSRPEVDTSTVPQNRCSRWELLSNVSQNFWKRWSREYLHSLIQRSKWCTDSSSPKVGDVVVLTTENCPPMKWPLAKVISLHPASDGVVRIVSIRTSNGTILNRPVRRLLVLPICP